MASTGRRINWKSHGGHPRGRGVPTFAEAAKRTIELHRDGWKAGSPLPQQWESTFRLHAAPLLDMPVDRIESADVLGCLAPIWTSKPADSRKARNRIAAVFRWCIGRNHRADNPVDRGRGAAEGERQRAEATRQTVNAIEGGKYSPSHEVAFRIVHVFGKLLELPAANQAS